MFTSLVGRVCAGEDLSLDEMRAAIGRIMQGECSEGEIATLLTALAHKGETVDELAGAAAAMREHMTPIRSRRTGILDTCGTGGVGSSLFNVSTAAAIVAAAAGVPVAKHGNRSVTSRSGSADVLEKLGVNVDASPAVVERSLDEIGLCFCFARTMHPAMRHVAAVRKKLGIRTIFNLLGPLSNPAGAECQLLGTGLAALREKLAQALLRLGAKRAVLVTGEDGLGEVTLSGKTFVTVAENGALRELTWTPADFGLEAKSMAALAVAGPDASAAIIRDVLTGARGAARETVVLNAAAALWSAGKDDSPVACANLASEAIDGGSARQLLSRLAELSYERH
jgi:anthranilate phosphoribosyltransferase